MKLTISILAEYLSSHGCSLVERYGRDTMQNVSCVRLFHEGEDWDDGTVYLTDWKTLSHYAQPPKTVICTGSAEGTELTAEDGTDFAAVADRMELAELYEMVCGAFFYYQECERKLKDCIIQGRDLSATLNIVSEMFDGNAVLVSDAALRMLRCSDNLKEATDSYALGTLQRDYSDQRIMKVMNDSGKTELLDKTEHALYIDQPPVPPFFCTNFMDQGKRMASITVTTSRKALDIRLLPLLDSVAEVLQPLIFQIGSTYYLHSSNLQKVVLDMIGGAILDERVLQKVLSSINWNINDEYCVLQVELGAAVAAGGTAGYVQQVIGSLFRDSILVEESGAETFSVVLHCTGHEQIDEMMRGRLSSFLKDQGCRVGVSMRYYDFSMTASAYKLSKIALEKGEMLDAEGVLYHYEDYLTAHLIDMCALSIDVLSLCHPETIRLYQYDYRHETDFLNSLYQYVLEEKHISAAAVKLHIHRNTLVYRLSKISEICNLNLEDASLRIHILLSCQILQYLKPDLPGCGKASN